MNSKIGGLIISFLAITMFLVGCAPQDEVIFVDHPVAPNLVELKAQYHKPVIASSGQKTGANPSSTGSSSSDADTMPGSDIPDSQGTGTTGGSTTGTGSSGSGTSGSDSSGSGDSSSSSGSGSGSSDDDGNVDDYPEYTIPQDRNSQSTTGGTVYDKDKPDTSGVDVVGVSKIIIKDLKFSPVELTIKQNTTVVWESQEDPKGYPVKNHRVAAHYNEFRSGDINPGGSYNHTFINKGSFTYIDVIYQSRMWGKITVT